MTPADSTGFDSLAPLAFASLLDFARMQIRHTAAEACDACNTINLRHARTCRCCAHKLPAFYAAGGRHHTVDDGAVRLPASASCAPAVRIGMQPLGKACVKVCARWIASLLPAHRPAAGARTSWLPRAPG